MTVKEFWHLKYGTVVKDMIYGEHYAWQGKVIKRELIDEWTGELYISKTQTIAPTTGRKILEITFEISNGDYRYLQSNRINDIKNLQIVETR